MQRRKMRRLEQQQLRIGQGGRCIRRRQQRRGTGKRDQAATSDHRFLLAVAASASLQRKPHIAR
jgi:hypothetical protein